MKVRANLYRENKEVVAEFNGSKGVYIDPDTMSWAEIAKLSRDNLTEKDR
jgi:hypothetical protein